MTADEEILRVSERGEGVTTSGRHFALAAPGDMVEAGGIIRPGPHHAVPPCRHFPECGGCQLQHLDDEAYSGFLRDRILAALAVQRLTAPEMRPAHISPPCSRRRASLSAERTGGRVLLGFRPERSHRIVDMQECHILRNELFQLVSPLRKLLGTILPHRRSGSVKMTLADQGPDVLLEGVAPQGLAGAEALSGFAQTYGLARLSIDEGQGPEARWEPEPVTITLGETPVPFPANSFLQATADGEAALVASVREAIGPARVVADLFAGLGTFGLALEGRILAAEGDRDSALALKGAANRAQRQLWVDYRDLFRRPLDAKELERFEAVVLDPPRAGAREQVALLAVSTVPRIAYVSCNPATFARDAVELVAGGYRLLWIRPVGQFRWSTHVELVAAFER